MRKKISFLLFLIFAAAAAIFTACAKNSEESAGLLGLLAESGTTPAQRTPAPKLTGSTFLSADRYCVAGKGENGAEIRVEGGISPVFGIVSDGQFIVEIFLENQNSKNIPLEIYAKSADKSESEPLQLIVEASGERTDKPLCIGKNNHIHYNETMDDFTGKRLLKDSELKAALAGAEGLQKRLYEEGLSTKVIIFIPPNHGTIYPETVPDFWADQKVSDDSALSQLTRLFSGSSVKFISPYARLMKEKENYFLYNKTDTHWNDLGAYFGYCELFDYIGETFPEAKARPIEDFDVYRSVVNGGDLIPMLQFSQKEVTEHTYVVRIKNSKIRELFRDGTDEIPYQETQYHEYQEYTRGGADTGRPTILMYRDSFSVSMMSPMAETSKRIVFYAMWDYNIDIDYVKSVNPDFLVIQRVERSLQDLPGLFRKFR